MQIFGIQFRLQIVLLPFRTVDNQYQIGGIAIHFENIEQNPVNADASTFTRSKRMYERIPGRKRRPVYGTYLAATSRASA